MSELSINTSVNSPTSTTKNVINILLADDHAVMREGTRRLLEEDPSLKVVGEAQDGAETIAKCQQLKPDVVVLDIAMKGMNGFEAATKLLNELDLPPLILVLTGYDAKAYVRTMLKMGVKGYWLKSAYGSQIRQAVHEVAAGRQSLDPQVRRLMTTGLLQPLIDEVEPLTGREIEVLQLLSIGVRNAEIGERLSISVKTVERHLTSLYGKLGVQSRAEAIALAQKQGLLLQ